MEGGIRMDIPRVIEKIKNGKYKEMYWGPLANSENTYEELKSKWPKENPELPTKEEMELCWATIEAEDLAKSLLGNGEE